MKHKDCVYRRRIRRDNGGDIGGVCILQIPVYSINCHAYQYFICVLEIYILHNPKNINLQGSSYGNRKAVANTCCSTKLIVLHSNIVQTVGSIIFVGHAMTTNAT